MESTHNSMEFLFIPGHQLTLHFSSLELLSDEYEENQSPLTIMPLRHKRTNKR